MEKKEDKKRRQIFLDKPAVFGVYLTSISDAGERIRLAKGRCSAIFNRL
jgi:hypothetical protein